MRCNFICELLSIYVCMYVHTYVLTVYIRNLLSWCVLSLVCGMLRGQIKGKVCKYPTYCNIARNSLSTSRWAVADTDTFMFN